MQMNKHDIESTVKWPANAPCLLTREQQIELMSNTAERHAALIKRTIEITPL
jgi:hypothetical protein